MHQKLSVILLLILLITAPASALAAPEPIDHADGQQEAVAFVQTTANLRLRSLPTSDAPVLQTIPQGTTVRAIGRDANINWLWVEFRGVTGWVSVFYVRTSDSLAALTVRDGTDPNAEPPPPASQTTALDGTVVSSGTLVIFSNSAEVNVRAEPSIEAPSLTIISPGTRVIVDQIDTSYTWGRVNVDGITGWVALWVVNTLGDIRTVARVGDPTSGSDLPLPSTGPGSVLSAEQRQIIQDAQDYLGRYIPNASGLIDVLNNGASNGLISCGPDIPFFRDYRPTNYQLERVPELATVRDNMNTAFDFLNRARAQWLIACTGNRTLLFKDQYPVWLGIALEGLPFLDEARAQLAALSAR